MGLREDHPVIPTSRDVSRLAIQAASELSKSSNSGNDFSMSRLALPSASNYRENSEIAALAVGSSSFAQIFKRPNIDELEKLDRTVKTSVKSNFVVTKAHNLENLPDKA